MRRDVHDPTGDARASVVLTNPSEETRSSVHALQVGAGETTIGLESVLSELGWRTTVANDVPAAIDTLSRSVVDVVAISAAAATVRATEVKRLVRCATDLRIAIVMIGPASKTPAEGSSLLTYLSDQLSLDELRGRLAMVEHYHGILNGLERELARMQHLADRFRDHFQELDEEMSLAGRLQRDLLPDLSETIHGVRFASLYRPATWVSGDMFDVFRIDETHTGIYLADAVGHGLAAGLLTMFIKRVIAPKRIHDEGYEITSPSDVLAGLNRALVAQQLPGCQFVTACYGVLDHAGGTFTVARAGHPYPMHQRADGGMSEMRMPGGLLGVSCDAEYPQRRYELAAGDRVILHTDGLEHLFGQDETWNAGKTPPVELAFQSLVGMPLSDAIASLGAHIDAATGPQLPRDDMTILAFEWPEVP